MLIKYHIFQYTYTAWLGLWEQYKYIWNEFFKHKEVIGEITLVIKGICQEKYQKLDEADLKRDLRELINAGLSLSAASKYLAKKNDIKKSIIYNLNLRLDKS